MDSSVSQAEVIPTEPEQVRKVFVGGLSQNVREEQLRSYFSRFGPLTDCVVMMDVNGRSRGFGFVTYTNKSMVDDMMRARPHTLDGKVVDAKRAMPKDETGRAENQIKTKKLFIGGIREGLDENMLRDYFGSLGRIVDCVVMRDSSSGALRGFGFVEFDDHDPVDQAILQRRHTIHGQDVEVKKAVPKQQQQQQQKQQQYRNQPQQPASWSPRRNVPDFCVNRQEFDRIGLSSSSAVTNSSYCMPPPTPLLGYETPVSSSYGGGIEETSGGGGCGGPLRLARRSFNEPNQQPYQRLAEDHRRGPQSIMGGGGGGASRYRIGNNNNNSRRPPSSFDPKGHPEQQQQPQHFRRPPYYRRTGRGPRHF